jgi:hypothetical protein
LELSVEQFTVALTEVDIEGEYERLPAVKFASSKRRMHPFGEVSHSGVELHPAAFFKAVHASGGFNLVCCFYFRLHH